MGKWSKIRARFTNLSLKKSKILRLMEIKFTKWTRKNYVLKWILLYWRIYR
jgi:hypothetical protein